MVLWSLSAKLWARSEFQWGQGKGEGLNHARGGVDTRGQMGLMTPWRGRSCRTGASSATGLVVSSCHCGFLAVSLCWWVCCLSTPHSGERNPQVECGLKTEPLAKEARPFRVQEMEGWMREPCGSRSCLHAGRGRAGGKPPSATCKLAKLSSQRPCGKALCQWLCVERGLLAGT